MAAILKIIERMLRLPPEMRFEDAVKVLEHFGWTLKKIRGSHFGYSRRGYHITVVKHKNKIKKIYIKKIIEILNLEEWYEEDKR